MFRWVWELGHIGPQRGSHGFCRWWRKRKRFLPRRSVSNCGVNKDIFGCGYAPICCRSCVKLWQLHELSGMCELRWVQSFKCVFFFICISWFELHNNYVSCADIRKYCPCAPMSILKYWWMAIPSCNTVTWLDEKVGACRLVVKHGIGNWLQS